MEQRERDESSSKLEEALRELTGAETTGKIEEYENEREGADVDSETACTDMRRAERMPAWRQEEDARKSKLSESRVDVVNELNDDDWEQEELDELDEKSKQILKSKIDNGKISIEEYQIEDVTNFKTRNGCVGTLP